MLPHLTSRNHFNEMEYFPLVETGLMYLILGEKKIPTNFELNVAFHTQSWFISVALCVVHRKWWVFCMIGTPDLVEQHYDKQSCKPTIHLNVKHDNIQIAL